MCIYYKDRNNLTYTSAEHIIPAGLGGIKKLPNEMVSDQFNNHMSKYETWLLQDSLLNSTRQIIGPGSRGRTSPKHESKSQVHLMEDLPFNDKFTVGFIKKGVPRTLPYFSFDAESLDFSCFLEYENEIKVQPALDRFAAALDHPQLLRIKTTTDSRLQLTTIYFGLQKGVDTKFDAFYYKHPDNATQAADLPYADFAHSLRNYRLSYHQTEHQVKSHQKLNWKMEYFQVFAKCCFNLLAELKGKDYVLQDCFDPIRNYIVNGGDNRYAEFLTADIDVLKDMNVSWPSYSHIILLIPDGGNLYGICSLYKAYSVRVLLTENLPAPLPMDGLICDWRARTEYSLQRYILETAIKKSGYRQ